ncbi:hypothetical protein DFJ73DRAFT_907880, partial [Zopfochytrium polystomum]
SHGRLQGGVVGDGPATAGHGDIIDEIVGGLGKPWRCVDCGRITSGDPGTPFLDQMRCETCRDSILPDEHRRAALLGGSDLSGFHPSIPIDCSSQGYFQTSMRVSDNPYSQLADPFYETGHDFLPAQSASYMEQIGGAIGFNHAAGYCGGLPNDFQELATAAFHSYDGTSPYGHQAALRLGRHDQPAATHSQYTDFQALAPTALELAQLRSRFDMGGVDIDSADYVVDSAAAQMYCDSSAGAGDDGDAHMDLLDFGIAAPPPPQRQQHPSATPFTQGTQGSSGRGQQQHGHPHPHHRRRLRTHSSGQNAAHHNQARAAPYSLFGGHHHHGGGGSGTSSRHRSRNPSTSAHLLHHHTHQRLPSPQPDAAGGAATTVPPSPTFSAVAGGLVVSAGPSSRAISGACSPITELLRFDSAECGKDGGSSAAKGAGPAETSGRFGGMTVSTAEGWGKSQDFEDFLKQQSHSNKHFHERMPSSGSSVASPISPLFAQPAAPPRYTSASSEKQFAYHQARGGMIGASDAASDAASSAFKFSRSMT